MAIELKVPEVGESITEAMIGEWLVKVGDWIAQDEPVVVIETDKVNVELPAPVSGVIREVLKKDGDDARVGEVIGFMEEADKPAGQDKADRDAAGEPDTESETEPETKPETKDDGGGAAAKVMPAARRALAEAGLKAADVEASGPGGRLLKEDVRRHLERTERPGAKAAGKPATPAPRGAAAGGGREEERVKMTPLRRRVAERLVQAQQAAAMLTTFNEIDMSRVMALRREYQDAFVARHGVKLGFMSFFVKAAIEALREIPGVNAEIQDEEIVYRRYYDIGVAVGGGKGLVVPVIRDAERLSFAEIETTIADLAARAGQGKLALEELQGGTFTISNGGIYGSLLSTPILNPPQSGILGMHKIEERPVAVGGQVVVRPMMYVALTYDHRLVDGREAVTFLVRVKQAIEDPTRILLEV